MRDLMNHILFAAPSRLDSLSRGFRGRRMHLEMHDIVLGLAVVGLVALAAWGLSYLLRMQERGQGLAGPLRLFLALCREHGLKWSDQWLLYRVAKLQRLPDPARLFLEPERFQPINLGPLAVHAPRMQALARRLFALPPEEDSAEKAAPKAEPTRQPDASEPAASPLPLVAPPEIAGGASGQGIPAG